MNNVTQIRRGDSTGQIRRGVPIPRIVGGILKLTSTNPQKGGLSVVKVIRGGEQIASVEINHRKPIDYLRGLTRSKYFFELEKQLIPQGVCLSDIGIGGK